MQILVTDDEPLFQEIMKHKLAKIGEKEVTLAGSGAEALEIIRRAIVPFDLFLVDMQMPEMDGVDLVTAIRKISSCKNTPITMVTKVTERSVVDRAFAAGATDYLTKPLDDLELRSRIGVMQRIHTERQKNQALQEEVHKNDAPDRKIDFSDTLDLQSADFLIDLSVLSNYLTALGPIERVSQSAVGFNVENLENIYSRTDNELFIDVVENVATTLFNSLRPRVSMMSYVGAGTFVCVLNQAASVEPADLINSVENVKAVSSDFYTQNALPQPIFRCGNIARFGIFGMKSADQILGRAIKSAQNHSPAANRNTRITA